MSVQVALPDLPAPIDQYLVHSHKLKSPNDIQNVTAPYRNYESKLREIYAQQPNHAAASQNHLIPIFKPENLPVNIRARDLEKESQEVKDQHLLTLSDKTRRANGSAAIVDSFSDFKTNFNLFSESALTELDWSNVVAAGSSVVTALLPVDKPHNESKRALRAYYHQTLAPASDVDLFLYGLDEEQAIEKIKQIESCIRDSILSETTTIRTKNAISIVSEYPTRHIQIVLRLYKSPSEILTGFDVDCSAVAFDGKQVWAAPRAMAAFMTQLNPIDLSRRSPSYENRLSKYSHRGFEVFWPALDRNRIDPTIFERSFGRVMGLARLLVLEKLPHPNDRDTYLAQRREERGRPPLPWNSRYRHQLPGNVKDAQPDDIAEWVDEEETSNYHTFTIPYGPKYNAKKIEKLLFTKDLLLNAEWNKSKDRETKLHRHPAFFGRVEDVVGDCCGFCPKPETDEDLAVAEEENKIYISGGVDFLRDDPGRQAIGSFNPLTEDDWTEMAYIGNTTRLCQAIVDKDLEAVKDWFSGGELESVDVNRRDHAGRTPLQLATMCSTPEIVQYLIDHNARIVSRIYNGFTALHIAASRGEAQMVKALLERSEENQEEEDEKEEARREARRAAAKKPSGSHQENQGKEIDSDYDENEDEGEDITETDDESSDDITEGSFVKVSERQTALAEEENVDDPDVYDVDVLAWDAPLSPLHLAIIGGHIDVVEMLIDGYGADALLPVKLLSEYDRSPQTAILSLVLALQQPLLQAKRTVESLLKSGATASQADLNEITALHYAVNSGKTVIVEAMRRQTNPDSFSKAINFVTVGRSGYWNKTVHTPLLTAIRLRRSDLVDTLLKMGANINISLEDFAKAYKDVDAYHGRDPEQVRQMYQKSVDQPVILAAKMEMPELVSRLIDAGADPNTTPGDAHLYMNGYHWNVTQDELSLLELIQTRIKNLQESLKVTKPANPDRPEPLKDDADYLKYDKNSYQYWFATTDLQQAKEAKNYQMKLYKDDLDNIKRQEKLEEGHKEKSEAVKATITKLQAVEQKLKKAKAKTFCQLFPDAPEMPKQNNYGFHGSRGTTTNNSPYHTTFSFTDPHHNYRHDEESGSKNDLYLKLFEAAWTGDTDMVRSLSLTNQQPLRIAVHDAAGFTPYAIALLRGHKDLARTILDIATIQYKPKDDEPKYRYRLAGRQDVDDEYSDEESSVSNDDEPRVLKDLVSDKFTVDDITALANEANSKVSPLEMLNQSAEMWRMCHDTLPNAKWALEPMGRAYYSFNQVSKASWAYFQDILPQARNRFKTSLVRYAILKNDKALLRDVINTASSLLASKEDDEITKVYSIASSDFEFALKLGRVELVGEIIRSTGAGIPLQKMAQTSGVKLEEKPKYYQGLTVYGRKRQDWAERGRGRRTENIENDEAPLLRAIVRGNVEAVEYFFSDSPLNRYKEFASTFSEDKRILSLSQAAGGIEKALSKWLSTRSDLAVHAAVLTKPQKDGTMPLLEYVLKVAPNAIEAKSADGSTPLLLALSLSRIEAARMLIKAGANQAAKDDNGHNALGIILTNTSFHDKLLLPEVLKLLDQKLIQPLLLERGSQPEPGSLTPLAGFINVAANHHDAIALLKIILGYSNGQDLELLDGAGDYVLHKLVRTGNEKLVKFLVDYEPQMLYWENATGMTPLDIATTQYLRNVIEHPPSLNENSKWTIQTQSASSFAPKRPSERNQDQADIDQLFHIDAKDENDRSSAWRMHLLLRKLCDKYPGKRKLVSLLDANAIAKRLAAKQQKANEEMRRQERLGLNAAGLYTNRRYHRYENGESHQDEIGKWESGARGWTKWDYERWTREIMRKNGVEMTETEKEWERRIGGEDED